MITLLAVLYLLGIGIAALMAVVSACAGAVITAGAETSASPVTPGTRSSTRDRVLLLIAACGLAGMAFRALGLMA